MIFSVCPYSNSREVRPDTKGKVLNAVSNPLVLVLQFALVNTESYIDLWILLAKDKKQSHLNILFIIYTIISKPQCWVPVSHSFVMQVCQFKRLTFIH